jgi:hypothetical protein
MSDVPDWLWQGIAANLLADGLVAVALLAWKYREQIAQRIRTNSPQTIRIYGIPSEEAVGEPTLTAGTTLDARWNVLQTVGKSVDLRWNVEAPTPSLARRLEELASWYLHVS